MAKKQTYVLVGVLVIAAIAAIGGWVASKQIQSPADMAARAAPPTPSPILVPIEKRVLSSEIITRGTARFGLPQAISIVPSALKADAGLIATLPLLNTHLKEGDVLLTASGRPVFILQGRLPTYRDLVPGISGDDVLQLQRALKRLGFDPGPLDGVYTQDTGAAVAKWYKSKGKEPFGPTRDQLAHVSTLEREQLARVSALEQASAAVETARAKAEYNNRAAAAEVEAQIAARALIALDPRQPASALKAADAKLELARAALRSTQMEGEMAVRAAIDALKVAEFDVKSAAANPTERRASGLTNTRSNLGVQVPTDEIVFIPALPVRVNEVIAHVGDPAKGTVMTVTDYQLAIDSSLPLDAAPLVRAGMPVTITEQALGVKANGVVARVADTPGTNGVDGYHIYFEVRDIETSARLEGVSLRLTIPVKSTRGAVTVVPISALSLAADGKSRVQVENNGALEYVVVEPGLSADGYVEVTPVGRKFEPGRLVVVGYENLEKRTPP
jgi:peptidoglycan hydrolase-like protein with peptidoglycan-binding domain